MHTHRVLVDVLRARRLGVAGKGADRHLGAESGSSSSESEGVHTCGQYLSKANIYYALQRFARPIEPSREAGRAATQPPNAFSVVAFRSCHMCTLSKCTCDNTYAPPLSLSLSWGLSTFRNARHSTRNGNIM